MTPQPQDPQPRELPAGSDQRVDASLPARVVLWNDNTNTAGHVMRHLAQTLGLDSVRAETLMLTAHRQGRVTVATMPREHAELYQLLLKKGHLKVTLE